MAGANWHFLIAYKMIESFKKQSRLDGYASLIVDNSDYYYAGVQGPDYNFYPKGDGEISKYAHGNAPADLGRMLLRVAKTDEEKVFALGWLMHLTTDIITHPYVNYLMTAHFPKQTVNGTDHNAYQLGHHRVEWGIDLYMMQDREIGPVLPDMGVIKSAIKLYKFVDECYYKTFNYHFTEEAWGGGIESMVNYGEIFKTAWSLTGRKKDPNLLKQGLKSMLYYGIVSPLAKIIGKRNPENGAGVFIPINPREDEVKEILNRCDRVCDRFEDYLTDDFARLENSTG